MKIFDENQPRPSFVMEPTYGSPLIDQETLGDAVKYERRGRVLEWVVVLFALLLLLLNGILYGKLTDKNMELRRLTLELTNTRRTNSYVVGVLKESATFKCLVEQSKKTTAEAWARALEAEAKLMSRWERPRIETTPPAPEPEVGTAKPVVVTRPCQHGCPR